MKPIVKKVIGAIIGLVFGYVVSHYLITPYIFTSKEQRHTEHISKVLDQVLAEERAKIPVKIDEITTLVAVDRRDLKVAYTYEVDLPKDDQFTAFAYQHKQKQLCQDLQQNLMQNIEYDYIYQDTNGKVLLTIPVNAQICLL